MNPNLPDDTPGDLGPVSEYLGSFFYDCSTGSPGPDGSDPVGQLSQDQVWLGSFDANGNPLGVPTLEVVPPEGVGPEQVAADLKALIEALVAHERYLGGKGLAFKLTGARTGALVVAGTAVDPDGAVDRVRRLIPAAD